jgi:hypothetical protein
MADTEGGSKLQMKQKWIAILDYMIMQQNRPIVMLIEALNAGKEKE